MNGGKHRSEGAARGPLSRGGASLLAQGESVLWLAGGALALCLAMSVGLLALVAYQGAKTFWPRPVVTVELRGGGARMGEVIKRETLAGSRTLGDDRAGTVRTLLRVGGGAGPNVVWVDETHVEHTRRDEWAFVVERRLRGRLYGYPEDFLIDGNSVARSLEGILENFQRYHPEVTARFERRRELTRRDLAVLQSRAEDAFSRLEHVKSTHGPDSPAYRRAEAAFDEKMDAIAERGSMLRRDIQLLDEVNDRYEIAITAWDGAVTIVPLDDIIRAYPANRVSVGEKLSIYFSRWWWFLTTNPSGGNREGGVWPAIVGTVIMTLLMSVAVVPLGVTAALYLHEYAPADGLASVVRIAVANLAGVPGIVIGVLGLGLLCHSLGASVDHLLFRAHLPEPTFGKGGILWASLTMALFTLPVVVTATGEALNAVPDTMREASYACGANKWQTIRHVVLPRATPGILTGFILAVAKGTGAVAPLLLVGAVGFASDLPLDGLSPYLHLEREFMHLGYQIFDVAFYSPDIESAKPMLYTTTILLLSVVAALNLLSISIRRRTRRAIGSSTL